MKQLGWGVMTETFEVKLRIAAQQELERTAMAFLQAMRRERDWQSLVGAG